MNKSTLRSLLRTNQNASNLSQHLTFIPLVQFHENRPVLNPQGLATIEEQSSGRLFLVAVYSPRRILLNSIYHSNNVLLEDRIGGGVWVANYPRRDAVKDHHFLYLHVTYANPEQCLRLHVICSLICSAVLIDLADTDSLAFLSAPSSRILFSKDENNSKNNTSQRKRELASIVLLRKSKGKESIGELRRSVREAEEVLTQFKVPVGEINQLYREVLLFRLSSDAYEFQGQGYLGKCEEELNRISASSAKNEDLRSGPILREYLESAVDSLDKIGMVDITASLSGIRISQGYNGYLRAVEFYHAGLRKELREQGVGNLREVLRAGREATVEEYRKHSNDAGYLSRLQEHLDETEVRAIEENNKILDLKNLAYLKGASEELMGRVGREKMTQEQAQPLLDGLVRDYKAQASGDNKFEILTNYLSVMQGLVGKKVNENQVGAVRKELEGVRRQREEVEERLEALRRENNKKCCQIM